MPWDKFFVDVSVQYGIKIKPPKAPCWLLFKKRLQEYDESTTAEASRDDIDEDHPAAERSHGCGDAGKVLHDHVFERKHARQVDDDRLTEPSVGKRRRLSASPPVLISCLDTASMTSEEKDLLAKQFRVKSFCGHSCLSQLLIEKDAIIEASVEAINKILGDEGHGFSLSVHTGGNYDCQVPAWKHQALMLEHIPSRPTHTTDSSQFQKSDIESPEMEIVVKPLSFPSDSSALELINLKMSRIVRALGLETEGSIGWQLIASAAASSD